MIEQLENNEQVLLMYLADELPTADRAKVERMLALDPSLAAQLESLRADDAKLREGLAALDDSEQSRASEAAAVRRTVRAVRKRLLEPRDARPAANPRRTLRYPWWAYPTAAAASILLAFLVWWGNTSSAPRDYANRDEPSVSPEAIALLDESFDPQPITLDDEARRTREAAQQELRELASRDERGAAAMPQDPFGDMFNTDQDAE